MRFAILAVLAASVLLTQPLLAHEYTAGTLHVDHPYARATPEGAAVGGGYMTIRNEGSEDDRLIAVKSDVAERVEVHEMRMENDVMRMSAVEGGLPIPAGETVTLKPGGYHVMLMGLKAPLKEGDRHPATLVFEKAGELEVELAVEGMSANHSGDEHGEHSHGSQK